MKICTFLYAITFNKCLRLESCTWLICRPYEPICGEIVLIHNQFIHSCASPRALTRHLLRLAARNTTWPIASYMHRELAAISTLYLRYLCALVLLQLPHCRAVPGNQQRW